MPFFALRQFYLGAESRGFESPHPDHFYLLKIKELCKLGFRTQI